MKISPIITFLLLVVQIGFSQGQPFYENYTWSENPSYKQISDTLKPIEGLKHKIVTEFYFDEENNLTEYYLEHLVLFLNSDEKIEENNKVYIPFSNASDIIVNRARVVKQNGDVIELDESKILTATNEETGRQYKYFAFEGIEKGSYIEYYYVIEKSPNYKGTRISLQSTTPKKNVEFDLYSPKNLVFAFKSYNNLPQIKEDTLIKNKKHWNLKVESISGLEPEETSAVDASKAYLIYKLDKNLASSTFDISSFSPVSKNLYAYYYPEYEKNEKKALRKFVTEATKQSANDEASIARDLDLIIKTKFFVSDGNSPQLKELKEVLDKRVANETGIIKLYIAALRELNIKHELVLTCDRQEIKFDKDFEALNFLTDFLIYFPESDTYLAPNEPDTRYGFPPPYLTDNYGLFIKEVVLGDFKSGVGEVKYIRALEADDSSDTMIIDVNFSNGDITKTNISLNRSLTGYYAMYIQPYISLAKAEDKNELIESFARSMNENVTVNTKEMKNEDAHLFGVKPFQIILDADSEAFVEKAGNKYLFKVGELIGPQIQMYQEKERVLQVESEFNRSYYRTINVTIPVGYKITNLDDINIKNSFTQNGKEILSFHSYFTMDKNTLKITADEHYRKNILETELYEEYRTVINSAADFNKVVLVLEPI